VTGEEDVKRWEAARRRIRECIAHHTPRVLTDFPFEVAAAVIAMCMGFPFLVGAAAPASLLAMVGAIVFHLWAVALAIGGLTVAIGLRIGDRPNCYVVAAGLQLLGGAFGVYAFTAAVVLGMPALTAVVGFGTFSLISWARANHFRRIIDIQRGAARLWDER
jgi:hypothetical protein